MWIVCCENNNDDVEVANCSTCNQSYHLACLASKLNLDPTTLILPADWSCSACTCSSRGKQGRKDNAPVRQNTLTRPNKRVASGSPPTNVLQEEHQCLNKDDIREIIQTELRNVLTSEIGGMIGKSVSSYLQPMKADLVELKNDVASMKQSMDFINQEFEDIKISASESNKECNRLRKEVEALKTTNLELNRRINQIEQHSRACNLEIQCLPEHRTENLVNVAMQLAKVVTCDIKEGDIHHCTRTAKHDPNSTRPRAVILQMKSPIVRDRLLASVIKYNKAHQSDKVNTSHLSIGGEKRPVYVAEHLSPYNRELHRAARIAAKEKKYKFVWVRSGRVFLRKDENAQAVVLKDLDSIHKLL